MSERGIALRTERTTRHVIVREDTPPATTPDSPAETQSRRRHAAHLPQRVWIGEVEVTDYCTEVSVRYERRDELSQARIYGTVRMIASDDLPPETMMGFLDRGGSVRVISQANDLTMVEYSGPGVRVQYS